MTAWADKSDSIDALAAALVEALGEMTEVSKTRTANAGSYSYSYADLADALGMARPILASHGLAVTQAAESTHDEVIIWTTIVHRSGQYVTYSPTRLPAGKTAQNTGSAVTYSRRYSLMAVLGLATEDDDGAGAAPRGDRPRQQGQRPPVKKAAAARSEEESEMRAMLASVPSAAAARIRGEFKAVFGGGLSELPVDRHVEALDWMLAAVSEWEHGQADARVE